MFLYFWMITQMLVESLPISSSGHVVLLQKIAAKYGFFIDYELVALDAFDYVLQGCSGVVIFLYFFYYWWDLVVGKPVHLSSLLDKDLWLNRIPKIFAFGLLADTVTFFIWYLDMSNAIKLPLFVGFAFTAGALWSIQFARVVKNVNLWSWKSGVVVGFVQGCALLPGISRFGTTVATLQWFGYSGRQAFSVSFLLQWPLVVAGSLKGYKDLADASIINMIWSVPFIATICIAGAIAYALLWKVGKVIDKNKLWKFSYYMIIPIIIALFF